MSNKRSQPRYDVVVPIRFRDADDFLVQYSENISSGGVFVRTQFPPEEGTELRLSLEVPGTKTALPVTGVVAYVVTAETAQREGRSPGCGVRFHEMDPATVRVLETFVERLQKRTRGNILIVDDEPQVLDLLAQVLRAAQFNVETVLSAIKAVKLVEYSAFDLILSDLAMTRMDGFEFRDHLRQNEKTADIPFILMSGSVTDSDREVAEKLGVRAFLEKPINHKQLVQCVMDAVVTTSHSPSQPAATDERKTSRSRVRSRQFAEIAYKKMQALGCQCQFTADETAVEGRYVFQHVNLRNIATDMKIAEAQVRSVGHDRVGFTDPRHLANLAPIPVLDLTDASAFEQAVENAYSARARWVELGRQTLLRYRISDEVSDPGFCALGRLKLGSDEVLVSVRNESTLAVETVNGRNVPGSVSPSDCIVDIGEAASATDVELAVETVVSRLREMLSAGPPKTVAPLVPPALPSQPSPALASVPGVRPPARASDLQPAELDLELEAAPPEPSPDAPVEEDYGLQDQFDELVDEVEEMPELELSLDDAQTAPPSAGNLPAPPAPSFGAPPPVPAPATPVFAESGEEVSLDEIAEDVSDLFGSMDELVLSDEVEPEKDDGILSLIDEDDLESL